MLPPTRSHSGNALQVAGDTRTGCARACCPAHQTTPTGTSAILSATPHRAMPCHRAHHTTPTSWDTGSSCRPESTQQPVRDLLHRRCSPRDRKDVLSTTDNVMTDLPHHQGKGCSPNPSVTTAQSLLAGWSAKQESIQE